MTRGEVDAAIIVIYLLALFGLVVLYNILKYIVQTSKKQRLFRIVLEYESGKTRTVSVKASTRDVAEHRALKRNPGAVSIKRSQ